MGLYIKVLMIMKSICFFPVEIMKKIFEHITFMPIFMVIMNGIIILNLGIRLTKKFPNDRVKYTEMKADFIKKVLCM